MKNGKILKRIGILFLGYIIMMTGVSGCMQKNKLSINACLSYMKDKYGTEFTLVEDKDSFELSASLLNIYVECSDYPGEKILVSEEQLNDGNTIRFHDNYVAIKYKQQTIHLAEKMVSDVLGECRVFYEPYSTSVQPDEFDNTTTFEEFISKNASKIDVYVLIPPNHSAAQKEKEMEALEQQWIENRFVSFCSLYYFSDEAAYQSVQVHGDIRKYGKCYTDNGLFDIDEDFTISMELWR